MIVNIKDLEGQRISVVAKIKDVVKYDLEVRFEAILANIKVIGFPKLVVDECVFFTCTSYMDRVVKGDTVQFDARFVGKVNKSNKRKCGGIKLENISHFSVVKSVGSNPLPESYNLDRLIAYLQTNKLKDMTKEEVYEVARKNKGINNLLYVLTELDKTPVAKRKGSLANTVFKLMNVKQYFVYRLHDNGVVVYVGSSNNLSNRFKQHKADKVFDEITICLCKDKEDMLSLENHTIDKLKPKYNMSVNLNKVKNYKHSVHHVFYHPNKSGYDVLPALDPTYIGANLDMSQYVFYGAIWSFVKKPKL